MKISERRQNLRTLAGDADGDLQLVTGLGISALLGVGGREKEAGHAEAVLDLDGFQQFLCCLVVLPGKVATSSPGSS